MREHPLARLSPSIIPRIDSYLKIRYHKSGAAERPKLIIRVGLASFCVGVRFRKSSADEVNASQMPR